MDNELEKHILRGENPFFTKEVWFLLMNWCYLGLSGPKWHVKAMWKSG
jgi:hypothetical protein